MTVVFALMISRVNSSIAAILSVTRFFVKYFYKFLYLLHIITIFIVHMQCNTCKLLQHNMKQYLHECTCTKFYQTIKSYKYNIRFSYSFLISTLLEMCKVKCPLQYLGRKSSLYLTSAPLILFTKI